MTPQPILARLHRAARLRAALDAALIGAPAVAIAAVAGWRLTGGVGAIAGLAIGLAVLAAIAVRRARRLDRVWLIRALDRAEPALEDSTALLFGAAPQGLAALQRARLESRIAQASALDLRPPWSWKAIGTAWAIGAAIVALLLAWPAATRRPDVAAGLVEAGRAAPVVRSVRLRITPPVYTGLPAREQNGLDAQAPEGSRLTWIIDVSPRPGRMTLDLSDDRGIPFDWRREGGVAGLTLRQPVLYRLAARDLPRQRLHRIDMVRDLPPRVTLAAPASQLVAATPGQRRWTPVFEVADDHGVAAVATLSVTVTRGEGENITVTRRTRQITGAGPARARRFAPMLDLAREGLEPGGDLIVQLTVRDNRPDPQVVQGPSVILRSPSNAVLADGLDGMLAPTMPAYFRSQRQIIIDAEALIAARRRTDPAAFLARSEGLGVDQAQLRLRYGQFMGEESEGGGIALPTNDAPAAPTDDTRAPATRPKPDDDHHAGDGHDHGDSFGSAVDAVREFGHAHDTGDAATLFDPGTRSTLAQALDAMWGSERELRQGRPEAALPFAHRALELLKTAQQASRLFLPRVGAGPPPIDMSRRLSGDREGIVAEAPPRPSRRTTDTALDQAWRALDGGPSPAPLDLARLETWVRSNRSRLDDPLAFLAAIDTVRNEPDCAACRRRLAALVWRALETPAPTIRRRPSDGASGRRYLEALR